MPGGHCPIVRPHHHHTKKNLPRVGDPPFIVCGWCGAHTKQARDKLKDNQRELETRSVSSSLWFGCTKFLAQRRCALRVHVCTYTCTRTHPRGRVSMHPDHYFAPSKPWFFDTRFGAPKRCPKTMFFGPENHPPEGGFLDPVLGSLREPQKVVPEPPKTWSRNPCFGPLLWDRKQAPKPWFSSPKPWFWAPKPLFWVKTAGKV